MFRMIVWLMVSFGFYVHILQAEEEYPKDSHQEQSFNLSDDEVEELFRTSKGRGLLDLFTIFGVKPATTRPPQSTPAPMPMSETSNPTTPLTVSTDGDVRNSDPFYTKPKAQQLNCTAVGANCKECKYIDWIEVYNKTIDDSVTAAKYTNFDEKKCFQRCTETKTCVLYTFNKINRICKIYNEVRFEYMKNDTNWSTFVRITPSFIFLSEWIVTRDRVPSGRTLNISKVSDFLECTSLCAGQAECALATLNRSNNTCSIYSKDATQRSKLKGNYVSIQHMSLFRDDSLWRYEDLGYVYQRNTSKDAFTANSFDECLEVCSSRETCNSVTTFASNRSTVDCFLYDNVEDKWIEDVPPTKAKTSFYKIVSLNNTQFRKLPNYVFVSGTTKPIETKRLINVNDCHRNAMNSSVCYWYSYNSTSKICKLYNSMAQMQKVKNSTVIDLATYSKSIPTKYVPFYGFQQIWLFEKSLNNIPAIGQSSGPAIGQSHAQHCLEKCLDMDNCAGVAIPQSQQNCSLYAIDSIAKILDNVKDNDDDVVLQNVQMYLKTGDPRLVQSEKQFRCLNNPIITWDDINQILQSDSLDTIRDDIPRGNNLPLAPHGSSFEGVVNGTTPTPHSVKHSNVAPRARPRSKAKGKEVIGLASAGGAIVGTIGGPGGIVLGALAGAAGGYLYNRIVDGIRWLFSPSPQVDNSNDQNCRERCGVEADRSVISNIFLKSIGARSTDCICGTKPSIIERGHLLEDIGDHYRNGPLQENCTATKSVGEDCIICCRVGYDVQKNPTCTCSEEEDNYWKPQRTRCAPSNRCLLGTTDKYGGTTMQMLQVTDCKGDMYYGVVFDTFRRLPFYTAYHFSEINSKSNRNSKSRPKWAALACPEVALEQYTETVYKVYTENYPRPHFARGHLAPNADIQFHKDARIATHLYCNAAPQDSYTNSRGWKNIEESLRALFQEETKNGMRKGYVITGICLRDRKFKAVTVPFCFWKMACTRNNDGVVTVAGFYHENILSDSQAKKDSRDAELDRIVTMEGLDHLNLGEGFKAADVWEEAETFFLADGFNGYSRFCKTAKSFAFPPINKVNSKASADYTLYNFWREKIYGNGFNDTSPDTDTEEDVSVLNESGSPPSCGTKIVGYVTGWSDVKLTTSAASYLTHIIFAFIQMKSDGTLVVGSADPENTKDASIDTKKSYLRLYEIRAAKERSGYRLRTIFAVGGWENSQFFPATAGSRQLTQNFIRTAIEILDYFNMDGIDLDWEYPVTGGAREGTKQDRENYVSFLKAIKSAMADHQRSMNRAEPYSLTIAGAAGSWVLEDGFDLPAIADIVDWINVMTYDYNGAWESKWGAYTGPHAPLFFGAPEGYSGKTNVDYTMKYYSCRIQNPSKLVMGLGFYGRYWNSTGKPVGKSGVWRMANENSAGKFDGGFEPWRNIEKTYLQNPSFVKHFDEKTQTPYLDHPSGFLMGYENDRSIHEKVKYASAKGFAGVMIWAVDLDDKQNTLLRTASSESLCSGASGGVSPEYKCPPIQEQRWWTLLDDQKKAGMCGKSAPLYKGYYPVCDPEDPGYACCSASGYCGSGSKFCKCDGCVDYFENPEKILDEPIKPTTQVRWHTMDKFQAGPQCGYLGHKLENGKFAICNPDDDNGYCCSAAGYCGKKAESCDCEGCVNFRKNPNFEYPEKTWIDSGPDAGKCGKNAQVNGKPATCNPLSKDYHCCSNNGYCGSGSEYCDCKGCVNYKKK